jgi:hypothetical protein
MPWTTLAQKVTFRGRPAWILPTPVDPEQLAQLRNDLPILEALAEMAIETEREVETKLPTGRGRDGIPATNMGSHRRAEIAWDLVNKGN